MKCVPSFFHEGKSGIYLNNNDKLKVKLLLIKQFIIIYPADDAPEDKIVSLVSSSFEH